jgi:hypothetical protein
MAGGGVEGWADGIIANLFYDTKMIDTFLNFASML